MIKLLKHPVVMAAGVAALAVGSVHIIRALTVDRTLEYKEVGYRSGRVPASLDGYTIAFLSDMHFYPRKKLREMAAQINARGVELVLLGGDFSGRRDSVRTDLDECAKILSEINPIDGFYGVRGNHDLGCALHSAMRKNGMRLLENEGARVRPGLYIAGLEDLWTGSPDLEKALRGRAEDDVALVVCHNPDTSMQLDFSGVDLALSGHTHGGEITLFGLFAPAMPHVSRYCQRFASGWCESAAGTSIYVGNGIGAHAFRCFARPQVIYMTLCAK